MSKKWTDEEIQFLKFAYPNKDFAIYEICEALNKKEPTIRMMASKLNIKRYKEKFPDGYKRCSKCKTILPLDFFVKRRGGYDSWCRECHKTHRKTNKEIINKEIINKEIINKQCVSCKKTKSINEFQKSCRTKDGYNNTCKQCRKVIYERSKIKKLKERGW